MPRCVQLIRGDYGWLGAGWAGCNAYPPFYEGFERDYGVPVDRHYTETSIGTGVFERRWSKATVQFDCNAHKGKITPTIPPIDHGACSASIMNGVNLVYKCGQVGTCKVVSHPDNATACQNLCTSDPTCNFWTWHDRNQGEAAKACFLRSDATYDYYPQAGHYSGICNHTL